MHEQSPLVKQSQDAFGWVNKYVSDIPEDQWWIIPDGINTHMAWQVGHLCLSCYYHAIMVICGHQPEILKQVPIKLYVEYYDRASPEKSVGVHMKSELLQHMEIVETHSLKILSGLNESDLENDLFDVGFPHPVAKTKWEAIDWNIKHYMYHVGQIGLLRKALGNPFTFKRA